MNQYYTEVFKKALYDNKFRNALDLREAWAKNPELYRGLFNLYMLAVEEQLQLHENSMYV